MDFYAVDIETANERITSICQIGIVHYVNGTIADEWESLINPECAFKKRNISIHNISEETVLNAPTIRDIYFTEVFPRLSGNNVVCHGHFDRSSIISVAEEKGMPVIEARQWIDSSRLAKAIWEDFAKFGGKLAYVCDKLNIDLNNHNALSDARAAAEIVSRACIETGKGIDDLCAMQFAPKCGKFERCEAEINTKGIFYGETIVFTGSLARPRREAEAFALQVGFTIGDSVTKRTTILVVGNRDIELVEDFGEKSGKHKRAEELIAKGVSIRILTEADFEAMISHM